MSAPGAAVEVIEIVDSAPYVGLPLGIAILTICIMLVDGYGLQAMSFVAPAIVADWGVARSDLGLVLTASMMGMAVGCVALGRLSDRIGRKGAILSSLLSVCIGSLLSAHAHSLSVLVAWRALTGIGLGGLTPLATTFVAEWSPRRVRTLAVACVLVSVPLGGMLGAMAAQRVIPAFGWVGIFWIGVLLAGVAFNGMQSFVYAIGAHSYPTYVRGAGVGSAQTISRIGGVLGGLAAGAFFGLRPQPPVSTFFYAVGTMDIVLVLSYYLLRTHIPPNPDHLKGTRP